jgi:hypothetical protein
VLKVADTTPTQHWKLKVDLTPVPTSGTHQLDKVTAKCGSTTAVTLTNGVFVTVCTGSGTAGTATETITLTLTVPANTYAGIYTARLTWKVTTP